MIGIIREARTHGRRARPLDRGQFVAACAAVRLTRTGAVAWDLDANATPAALMATGQRGACVVVCHLTHPFLCRGRLRLWGTAPSLYTPYGYLVNSRDRCDTDRAVPASDGRARLVLAA